MRTILHSFFLSFVVALPSGSFAQWFDRMYQPSLYSSYSAVLPAPDSGWYVTGNVGVDNSFYSYGLLRKLDNNGSVLMEAQVQIPGYETAGINALATTGTGTLLVAGVASAGCDYGPFEALLYAFTDAGMPLWQHRYAVEPAQDMAVNDSLIVLVGYPYLLFTDLNGDSLHQTSVDNGYTNRAKANSAGFVCLGYQGALQVLPNGTSSNLLEGVIAIDLVEFERRPTDIADRGFVTPAVIRLGTDRDRCVQIFPVVLRMVES